MAIQIHIAGAGLMPCALRMGAACVLAAFFAALCVLPQSPLPTAAMARETAQVDSPAWCARQTHAQEHCLRLENACRANLPDMTSAGGCPSRELEACVARQDNGGSWCAILCCIEPDHPACRAAAQGMPQVFGQPER